MAGRVAATIGVLAISASALIISTGTAQAAGAAGLVADTNRDGRVDLVGGSDQAGKGNWTPDRGAIFLPNLDDDSKRCKVTDRDLADHDIAVDIRLAACNDAQDDVLNGADDAADLAPLGTVPKPELGDQATGEVSLGPNEGRYARLWANRGGKWVSLGAKGKLTAQELRVGARLAVEGRDVIRDSAVWNGVITVTLTVTENGKGAADAVQLRVAPLILQNDLMSARKVLTSRPSQGRAGYAEFVAGLHKAIGGANLPQSTLATVASDDRWFQDIFEPTTASMPGVGGKPQVMHVLLRSANYQPAGRRNGGTHPAGLRDGGRVLFTALRGPGVGVVQQYTDQRPDAGDDSLNSTGNFDSLPPYAGHPLGRPLYGSAPSRQPDPSYTKLIGSQYAKPVVMDTSWLVVGHVDETTHVIPARNTRGWTMMVADPRLAVDLMRQARKDGHGAAKLFAGTSAGRQPTIDAALSDERFLADNEAAATHIDNQIATLTRETGLAASELVRVPVLFSELALPRFDSREIDDIVESGRMTRQDVDLLQERMKVGQAPATLYVASTASIPNGVSITSGVLGAPDPHGPRVGGVDVFKKATEQALTGYPMKVSWVEDWDFVHVNDGEVHCGTNALREPTRADWWQAKA